MNLRERLIYLDYAATTPVDPRVAETIASLLGADGDFANPSCTQRGALLTCITPMRASSQALTWR